MSDEQATQHMTAVEVSEAPIVTAGMVLWAIALILLATVFYDDLQRHHATWWLWSCGLGLALGLYGLWSARLRRRRLTGAH